MPVAQTKKSYRDLDPLEEGGSIARNGFDYQDHVAAGKCLDMLSDAGPCEVWCEAEDDIVLVWLIQGEEWFEFVQVKSNELDQLWSVTKLCEKESTKDGKKAGTSIIEKSLAHDRGDGNCRFRFVTRREPNAELAILQQDIHNPYRVNNIEAVIKKIEAKLTSCKSENGNGPGFWIRMTLWEHKASVSVVENENLVNIDRILHRENVFLAPDQKKELYNKLLRKVCDASNLSFKTHKEKKKFKATELLNWLLQQASVMSRPISAGRSNTLEVKLMAAGYKPDGDEIETAKDQRRKYLHEIRQPKFLDLSDRTAIESEVQARLCRLKAQLDAGEFTDDG
ncbi:DUF4297 domain-containing protein, partial [Desulfobulbus sp. F4]|nr:DUF4297 domain-containing protein [Desulfobulbus sp. F4]